MAEQAGIMCPFSSWHTLCANRQALCAHFPADIHYVLIGRHYVPVAYRAAIMCSWPIRQMLCARFPVLLSVKYIPSLEVNNLFTPLHEIIQLCIKQNASLPFFASISNWQITHFFGSAFLYKYILKFTNKIFNISHRTQWLDYGSIYDSWRGWLADPDWGCNSLGGSTSLLDVNWRQSVHVDNCAQV